VDPVTKTSKKPIHQLRPVLMIFPHNLPTHIIAEMLSIGGCSEQDSTDKII